MTPVLSVELELFAAMYAAVFFVTRHMDTLMGFNVPLILVLVCAKSHICTKCWCAGSHDDLNHLYS